MDIKICFWPKYKLILIITNILLYYIIIIIIIMEYNKNFNIFITDGYITKDNLIMKLKLIINSSFFEHEHKLYESLIIFLEGHTDISYKCIKIIENKLLKKINKKIMYIKDHETKIKQKTDEIIIHVKQNYNCYMLNNYKNFKNFKNFKKLNKFKLIILYNNHLDILYNIQLDYNLLTIFIKEYKKLFRNYYCEKQFIMYIKDQIEKIKSSLLYRTQQNYIKYILNNENNFKTILHYKII